MEGLSVKGCIIYEVWGHMVACLGSKFHFLSVLLTWYYHSGDELRFLIDHDVGDHNVMICLVADYLAQH